MTAPDDRLLDYLYGEMTAEERRAFEEANQNSQVQKELQELQRARSILRSLPQESPSAVVSQSILRQARLHADQMQRRQGYWARSWKPLTMIGATAAAALALIISMRTFETQDVPGASESPPRQLAEPNRAFPDRQPQPPTPLAERTEPLEVAPEHAQKPPRSRREETKRRAAQPLSRQLDRPPAATPFAEQDVAPADSIQAGAAAAPAGPAERNDIAAAPKASRSIQSPPASALESGLLLLRDGKCLAAFPFLERALAANAQASARIASELSSCRRTLAEHRARYPRLSRLLEATSPPSD